jgi:hypothetical protein
MLRAAFLLHQAQGGCEVMSGHLSTQSRACMSRSVSAMQPVPAPAILHREPKYTRWALDTLVGCFLESFFARAFQQRRAQAKARNASCMSARFSYRTRRRRN